MSRPTFRYSQSKKEYQAHKYGEYDADHDKITTYSYDSRDKKYVLDINGKYDKTGKEVDTYKYCKADKEYRRHVGGKYDRNGKELRLQSNLTAAINSQRSAAETRPQSGTSTSGSGSRPRTESRTAPAAGNSGGRTLSSRDIDRQRLEDAQATELYHNGEAPPPYRPRGDVEIDRNNPLYAVGGVRGSQQVPGYNRDAPSLPKSTGQTYALGRGVAPTMETFGGRRDPKAPLGYSSGDASGRGNKTSSDEAGYSSQDMFNMSGLSEGLSSSDNRDTRKPKGESSRRDAEKEAARKKDVREGKKPAAPVEKKHRQTPSSASGSLADSENSPPQTRRVGGSGRESGRSDRHHDDKGKKRETSRQRRDRKDREADAARRERARKPPSSDDDLYGMST
ncbi:hypothetical protein OCU04_003042 [Sclerotinia nivalis]|uniref:Uncharacterized protein n=1 Tax=Sclerotinia nivalis TaxID=352851 RepID=A0A9X0AYA0_9HELO|nr:hypothetical protein OCU04_003042 [Sclerotinia nivalis]